MQHLVFTSAPFLGPTHFKSPWNCRQCKQSQQWFSFLTVFFLMISCQRRPLQTAPVFVFVRLNHRTTSCLKFWPWTQNQLYNFKNNYRFNCVLFNVFLILFLYRNDNTNILLYQILRKCCKMFVIFTWRVFSIREILYCIYSLSFYKQLLIFLNCLLLFLFIYLFFKCTQWKDASAIL